ncbi:TetR/AcrR family transcriptional regulator C-terminal ligand-binding domain-containing protein [Streptomyces sp. NPDC087859]|uniref:TetR/AcrR family transcriptional regulator C-terminal ligand-binding domain-containing protein n=1 Tax=Streptomyces sp. NPDC087859 TaxID=3365812 RepID=UPI00381DD237
MLDCAEQRGELCPGIDWSPVAEALRGPPRMRPLLTREAVDDVLLEVVVDLVLADAGR